MDISHLQIRKQVGDCLGIGDNNTRTAEGTGKVEGTSVCSRPFFQDRRCVLGRTKEATLAEEKAISMKR
jgi:hypothetical protein